MTSTLKVQNIQYTDGDSALTIADGGGVTAASTLTSTGDLTVDTNTLFVDASTDKVHVGNTSDGDTTGLSVNKAGGGNFIAHFRNTTTGTPYGVKISAPSGDTSGYPLLYIGDHASEEYFKVQNNGIVTKPSTPRFAVYKSGSEQYINTANMGSVAVAITWNTAEVNIGSHFDLANEKFTAPVTGTYRFDFQMLTGIPVPSSGVYWASYQLMKNASTGTRLAGTPNMYVESYNSSGTSSAGQGGSGYHFIKVSGGCFAELAANDYVKLMMYGSDSSNVRVHSGTHSTWSGYLIG